MKPIEPPLPEQRARTLQCMEVWGGNAFVDSGVVMAGLDAWIYSKPYGGNEGGDVHYVSSCAAGLLTRLLIADVRGHGAAAADTAQILRRLMRRYINRYDQGRFVAKMNRTFSRFATDGAFATAVVTSYVGTTGVLQLSNAGHPPPLLYRVRDGAWTYLERPQETSSEDRSTDEPIPSDVPLGIVGGAGYGSFEVKLDVGDTVICYTDALSEACDTDGRMIGYDGLLALARSLPIDQPREMVHTLLQRIEAMHPENLLRDDLTVLLFRPNGMGVPNPVRAQLLAPLRYMQAVLSGK